VDGKPEDYAVKNPTPSASVVQLPSGRQHWVAALRERVRDTIQDVIGEELEAALGVEPYERSDARSGYRNGSQTRSVTSEYGPVELQVPRARLVRDGKTTEWHSHVVPRYERRTEAVNAAVLGAYLGGTNTRRIRRALEPLLGSVALSKSAISRIVGRLKESFATWRTRDLQRECYVYLYLDAMFLPVRLVRRVVKVPVQAVLGVREDGQKVVVALEIAANESTASWKAIVQDLAKRGLGAPKLVILDGNAGLSRAVRETWPGVDVQRCTKHKLENLLAKAPQHCHAELKRDYQAITHAGDAAAAQRAYPAFLAKWRKLAAEVARSLEEAGAELLTFTRYPRSQWKSLRTTNQIERLNGEFRRRTKTQGSFPNETAALVLLYGLVAMGQIQMRKIDGHQTMEEVLNRAA
jgi:putative transposase